MLFGKLNKNDKNKAVKIIYDTWVQYGTLICDVLKEKLALAMDKLQMKKDLVKLHDEYVKAETNIEGSMRFPDYLPVFEKLQVVITGNAELLKRELQAPVNRVIKRLSRMGVNNVDDYRNKNRFLRN